VADSTRQSIMEALDTRLKLIKTTGGYKTSAGTNVFDWLDRDLADSELDAIIYRDRTNQISAEGFKLSGNTVRVEIEARTKQSTTTAEQIREIIEDIYKAIGADETWGGLAIETNPISEEIDIQHVDKIMASATITIEVLYMTAKWSY
jgi:hypothetical protein